MCSCRVYRTVYTISKLIILILCCDDKTTEAGDSGWGFGLGGGGGGSGDGDGGHLPT